MALSAGSRTYSRTGGGEGVSEGISERAETAVLCLLARLRRGGTKSHFVSPSSDSQCRRTEWHSPSQPPHAYKDFHYGFTVITYTHTRVIKLLRYVAERCALQCGGALVRGAAAQQANSSRKTIMSRIFDFMVVLV
ncbi:hypothetical protein fugu_005744 [Takifugu bimaculatus]|uniref:Uncharacterized protein n=1 Tax=Takifugu bimaculatus TaxID=433685 RepID=A0A4Z2B586_9TELE|nr:hypothetical protein fugu_005744 [Takifugu bimaculatus]